MVIGSAALPTSASDRDEFELVTLAPKFCPIQSQ
jgi:hypothetical protein